MKKSLKKIIGIIIILIVVAILVVGGYFIFIKKGEDVREKLITAENYNEITEEITEQLKDSDDAYYFIYSCISYMSDAGLTEEYLNSQDESILYKDIYNKTVNQLIEEGKTMMPEDGITLEQFKEQVDAINGLTDVDEDVDGNEVNEFLNELETNVQANNEI